MASILVVDDSTSIREFLVHILVSAGHSVTAAANGQQALDAFKANPTDLVITDMYMPERDGLELMVSLRRSPRPPRMIAMSSQGGPLNVLRMARNLGARITLQKPFQSDALLSAVRSTLAA
ncbi:MAG: response regulator [Opitutaceae bacterium]|nr:response regulator [Opitutaceae bacterium]